MEGGKAVHRAKGSSEYAARLDGRRSPVNTGAPLPYGSGYSTFNASCTGGQPLDVLMESRMRWKSQVRFGVAAARRPPADKAGTGASPPTLRVDGVRRRARIYARAEVPLQTNQAQSVLHLARQEVSEWTPAKDQQCRPVDGDQGRDGLQDHPLPARGQVVFQIGSILEHCAEQWLNEEQPHSGRRSCCAKGLQLSRAVQGRS
jgi:hypothetical protein